MNLVALLQEGLAAQRAGDFPRASEAYRKVLKAAPKHPDALYLLGLIVQKEARHEEAIKLFALAAQANPKFGRAHLQRGFSLNSVHQPAEAATAFRAAAEAEPGLAEAHHQLGNTLRSLKQYAPALASLRRATELCPAEAVFWLSRGLAGLEGQQFAEAVESFQQAVKLNPQLPEAHEILAQALMAQQRMAEARLSLREALRLRPNFVDAHHDLGRIGSEEGLWTEAIAHYRAALAIAPKPATYSNLLFIFNYLPETEPATHFAAHRQWSEWFEKPLRPDWRPHSNNRNPDRPLRIGYVSPDFRDHPVTCFIEPILQCHRREAFETVCYANVKLPDAVTERLRGVAGQWRDIYDWAPERVAELIRQDGIDILVELAGHTTDNSLLVCARKPAPVQVTWIGYPNTTGLEAIDYRITDLLTDPPGATERWHSEELIRLPEAFSCYRAPAESPEVGPLPALANGHVTFGSFNNFRKLSEPTIRLWARLLQEVPGARLIIKSQGLGNAEVASRLRGQFVRAGAAAERIQIHAAGMSKQQHMGLYHQVDVCLDPFPYNGTTTTCDALWMGVPVVTLAGRSHVGRVGLSLVSHLGYPGWAVETPDAYVAKCRELTGDLPALAGLRRGLREQMRQSPLCDAPKFINHLEGTFRRLWQHWCAQSPAQP